MKKKKMFILLMILIAARYRDIHATIFPDQNNTIDLRKNYRVTNNIINSADLSGTPVISIVNNKYAILLGEKDTLSPINIVLDYTAAGTKKILNINSGNIISEYTVNRGILKARNKGNGNFEAVSIQKGNFRNEGKIEISGNKGTGINITNKGKIENTGEIIVKNKAKGIFLNYDNLYFKNSGTIEVENQNSVGITGNRNKNINILADEGSKINVRDKGTGVLLQDKIYFKNYGEINVYSNAVLTAGSEAVGVDVKSSDRDSFFNYGKINVFGTGKNPYSGYNAKGIFINNEMGHSVNYGTIDVKNTGIGVISKGSFKNEGEIEVDGKSIGINTLKTASVSSEKIENLGTIIVKGESYGIQAAGNVNIENNEIGKIHVLEGGIGIIAAKTGDINENGEISNKGHILIEGERTTGLQANDNREIINSGTVKVDARKYTSGVKAYGENSRIINEGEIVIAGDSINTSNAAISQKGGTIENRGKIDILSGTVSSGIAISTDSYGINTETGIININEGTGIKIEDNGIGINKGKINLITEKQVTGIQMGNSVFLNDNGEINGNEDSISIFSRKGTNNTVILKNNSSIKGKVAGNDGIDSLFLENAHIDRLNIEKYESIDIVGNSVIENSKISLEGNAEGRKYTEEARKNLEQDNYINTGKGILTLSNSTITLSKTLGAPIFVNGEKVVLKDKINLLFKGEQKEFSASEYLGGIEVDGSAALFDDTLVWKYRKIGSKDVVLSKDKYTSILYSNGLNEFAQYLEKERNNNNVSGDLGKVLNELELSRDREKFNNIMKQVSGVNHAYAVDASLINSKIFSEISLGRKISENFMRKNSLNSSANNIFFINKKNNLTGTMDTEYNEKGVLGVFEKQIVKENKLGIIYGASKGNLGFNKSRSGEAKMDTVYFGGYYDYSLNDKLSFLSTTGIAYSHVLMTRNINTGERDWSFSSSYPLIAIGAGSKIIYTPLEKNMLKFSMYAGLDVKRIFQGNINEEREKLLNSSSNLTIKNIPVDERYYNSVTPNIGISLQKNGKIANRDYTLGIGIGYEKELGNIKDFKYYKLTGLNNYHKIKSVGFKDIFTYGINFKLGLTENLLLTAGYKSHKGKDIKSDNVNIGFEYKGDIFRNNILNTIVTGLNNSKKASRWRKTLGLTLEAEDASDRYYYSNSLSAGDYTKSTDYKPLIWFNLVDTKSKISYYLEGYYRNNKMFQGKNSLEDEISSSRLLGEIRYRNSYDKGNYGFSIGYKAEGSRRPRNYNKKEYKVEKSGFHELRIDGLISYNLGGGYIFSGRTIGMADFYHKGERKGQTDYKLENQYGVIYNGLSPKWRIQLMYFRDDRWLDKKNNVERYELSQLRPSVTYNFGNGDNITFEARLPLGKGATYKETDSKAVKAETYEYRYGIKYTKSIIPGLNIFVSAAVSDIRVKDTNSKSNKFGETTRNHVFRPTIGINYSF